MPDLDFVTTGLRFSTNRLRIYTPSSENPANRLADLVVGRAGASGHADPQRTGSADPVGGRDFGFFAEWAVPNGAGGRVDIVRILDVEGADTFRTESRQRHGVARVVTADHHHHIEGLAQQLDNGVLALLRRAADGVEGPEILAP